MTPGRSCVFALSALLPAQAGAQTLDVIVAKSLAARGGAARIAAVTSLRMTAKARAQGGREALLVREVKRPGRVRLEFTSQGITGVYASDGTRGWQVSPLEGELEPRAMSPDAARAALEQSEIGGPLADWKARGHRLELAGRESLDGRPAFKLKLSTKDGEVRHLYVDAESYQHVRTEAPRTVRGHVVTMETTFGDYRETAGVFFPHAVVVGARGRPGRLRIQVQTVEVNPTLDDARFRMPEVR